MPFSMLFASPKEATVTSNVIPAFANGGSFAVTITAAAFFVFTALGSTNIPIFLSMFAML